MILKRYLKLYSWKSWYNLLQVRQLEFPFITSNKNERLRSNDSYMAVIKIKNKGFFLVSHMYRLIAAVHDKISFKILMWTMFHLLKAIII